MVLNLFKTLASKNEAAHHRTHHQSSRNETGRDQRLASTNRISRMAGSLPQTVPEVLTSSGHSSAVRSTSSTGGGVVMNRLHHHPLTGSLSAPSSPSTLKSSIPLKMSRHATTAAASGIRPPAPNIIVEKGRIEFVKTEPTATTTTTATPLNEKHGNNKLVMGTKIFRPPAPKKCESSPTHSGGSISFRDRSASPKLNATARESTPPLPESKIPSSRIKQQPDVVNSRNIPRPGLIKSRETSPAGASQTTGPSGSTSNNIQPVVQQVQQPAKSIPSAKNNAPVPVSPNLIRWRAKLSGSSGPSVTSHLNNVASGNNNITTTSPSSNPTNPGAGSQKKSTGSTGPTSPNKTSGTLANNKTTGDKPSPSNVQQQQQQVLDESTADVADSNTNNQMQLLNLHYEVKRLEETVQTLLPLRHQQSALIQSYEERLSEAQTRLAAAEAEVAQLKERLARCETAEMDGRQVIQQLEADKASVAASHEQQRIVFDKCLDEIANHVVQALISQKNLQGECRRLRSQVSDLEQRNVALNLLLTQSLRDSMQMDNKKADGMVKSNSYDVTTSAGQAGNPRDSVCSTVSDSEIRLNSSSSIFETGSGVRPLVSKDSNWTLSSSSSSSSTSQAALAVQQSAEHNPVERAEKLLAVLKHRLFSAQLNSYKSIRTQPRNSEIRRSLVLPVQSQVDASLPARPSTLAFCQTATNKEAANDPSTPSVRALVQVLEKRVANPLPAGTEKTDKSPRPPLPLGMAPGLMRAIRNAAVITGEGGNDSPASKDEGYSTMSSDVQVDSSSSSSSSFIASGCSSPATLRRSGSGSTPNSTTRSLPMAKRKTLLSSTTASASPESRPQPNRSISLQETHSGAGLEELKEEASDDTNDDGNGRCNDQSAVPSSGHLSDHAPSSAFKREWPGVQLGTLCEDWSPSSAASDSDSDRGEPERPEGGLYARPQQEDQNLQKWTSDSELYKAEQEVETRMEDNWKTLELKSQGGSKWQPETDSEKHPLRRSRAQIQLSNEASSSGGASVADSATFSCSLPPRVPNYSEHEMEDWILDGEHEPSPSESEEAGATALLLPAISENSYESDDEDEEEEQLFVPAIYTPECDQETTVEESGTDEEDPEEESLDTEFTRDYYRLVKFESNRSLANSEKYDHCPPGAETATESTSLGAGQLPPPDRQVALQTVLDFIAEQQRYCAIRETADAAGAPDLVHPSGMEKEASVSSLLQLRHLIPDDDSSREADSSDEDENDATLHDGFSTNWMPVHASRAELVDLNNAEVRASMLEKLLRSTSSSSSESGSCGSLEGKGLDGQQDDSHPPSFASPSADESQC